jgi:hypothetical protein
MRILVGYVTDPTAWNHSLQPVLLHPTQENPLADNSNTSIFVEKLQHGPVHHYVRNTLKCQKEDNLKGGARIK